MRSKMDAAKCAAPFNLNVSTQGDLVSTIKHTERFKINQPIEILFPLFSAEG
jgi:hypothetical protein